MGVEILRQGLLIDIRRVQPTLGDILGQTFGGARNLVPPAVVERDGQICTITFARDVLQLVHQVLQLDVEAGAVPDEAHPDVVGLERAGLFLDIAAKQAHQAGDLDLGPLPVLGRKAKDRQVFNALIGAGLDNLAHPLGPRVMAEQARATAHGRPTAVAIHDDRDMAGSPPGCAGLVHDGPQAQTCMISSCLVSSAASTFLM